MTVPVICGDVRNPFNNKKSRSYKKTELIITAVLTNSNSSAVSDDQTSSVSDSDITDVHIRKQPGHEQSLVPLPEEPDVDVNACVKAITNFLGESILKMLAGNPVLNEKFLSELRSIIKDDNNEASQETWWKLNFTAEDKAEARWKKALKDANCQPGDLLKALPKLMESDTICEGFRVMAQSIHRQPDSCKHIPKELQNLVAEYVNIELSSSLKEWESLLEQYRQNNDITSEVMNQICHYVKGINYVNGKSVTNTARLDWIRMGKLRIEFEQMKRDNAISIKRPFTTRYIEREFENALKLQTPHNVDQIEKPLKDLPDVCGDLKRSIFAREPILQKQKEKTVQLLETYLDPKTKIVNWGEVLDATEPHHNMQISQKSAEAASKEEISANVQENISPKKGNEKATRKPKPHKKRRSKWLKWLKRGVSLKGAIPITRGNPVALAA